MCLCEVKLSEPASCTQSDFTWTMLWYLVLKPAVPQSLIQFICNKKVLRNTREPIYLWEIRDRKITQLTCKSLVTIGNFSNKYLLGFSVFCGFVFYFILEQYSVEHLLCTRFWRDRRHSFCLQLCGRDKTYTNSIILYGLANM